jgi:hypothetical protein
VAGGRRARRGGEELPEEEGEEGGHPYQAEGAEEVVRQELVGEGVGVEGHQ